MSCPVLLVLGSWVGVRRLSHLSFFPTASRVVLPKILVLTCAPVPNLQALVVGEPDAPPAALPHAKPGDHVLYRVRHPSTPRASVTAVLAFGGGDTIASVGAFDATSNTLWVQVVYGAAYQLLGHDATSGQLTQNVSDPYTAGAMACGGGRCFCAIRDPASYLHYA